MSTNEIANIEQQLKLKDPGDKATLEITKKGDMLFKVNLKKRNIKYSKMTYKTGKTFQTLSK